jgi:hypothetical protein
MNGRRVRDTNKLFLVKLVGVHLRKIGDISYCLNLRICILNNNFLTKIDSLATCRQLIKLDLHSNQVIFFISCNWLCLIHIHTFVFKLIVFWIPVYNTNTIYGFWLPFFLRCSPALWMCPGAGKTWTSLVCSPWWLTITSQLIKMSPEKKKVTKSQQIVFLEILKWMKRCLKSQFYLNHNHLPINNLNKFKL